VRPQEPESHQGTPKALDDRSNSRELYYLSPQVGPNMPRCEKCGDEVSARAKYCPQCGQPLAGPSLEAQAPQRPTAPIVLSAISALGLVAVSYFMSFAASVPGEIGSPLAQLFRQVGLIQFVLGLIAACSVFFLFTGASRSRTWGGLMIGVGAASILSLLLVVASGTAGVLVFVLPALVALVAGRRAMTWKKRE